MSDALLGLGSPTDPFAAALALLAAVADPKAAQARLKQLQGGLAEVEKERAGLAAERSAVEADLQAKRAAFDEECAAKCAGLELSERARAKFQADLSNRERQFADRLIYAEHVIARYNSYWRIRIEREMGGAAPLVSTPNIFTDQDAPADAHFRTVAEGSFEPGEDAGADQVRGDNNGAAFPSGVSLTRSRPRRGMET